MTRAEIIAQQLWLLASQVASGQVTAFCVAWEGDDKLVVKVLHEPEIKMCHLEFEIGTQARDTDN